MAIEMTGHQRKYLRGLAHGLKPIVLVGQMGLSDAVTQALDAALRRHELVKLKFIDEKDKTVKRTVLETLEVATGASMVGMIGHTAIFYRPHPDAEQRNIILPPA